MRICLDSDIKHTQLCLTNTYRNTSALRTNLSVNSDSIIGASSIHAECDISVWLNNKLIIIFKHHKALLTVTLELFNSIDINQQ